MGRGHSPELEGDGSQGIPVVSEKRDAALGKSLTLAYLSEPLRSA